MKTCTGRGQRETRVRARRRWAGLVTAILASLVLAPASARAESPAGAAPAGDRGAAIKAMEAWLDGIDQGAYAESWNGAAGSFRKALTSEKWVAALDSVRKPLGAVESRKLASAVEQSDIPLPDGKTLEGRFVLAQFETAFANLKFAVETVTFEWENGQWKAAGYFIRPR